MSSGSRKRTVAPRDEGDPATFLDEYFRDRGISGRHDSEAAREVQMRAEQARERFKRMRTEAASSTAATAATNATNAATSAATGLDADTLTKEQKYNRRLANNRKSAAASRVYNEVLRKETDYTLKEVVEKAKRYKETIDNMNNQLTESQKENERMKKRIARLEEIAVKGGASIPSDIDIDIEIGTPVSVSIAKTEPAAPTTSTRAVKKEENHLSSAPRPYGSNSISNGNGNRNITHGGTHIAPRGASSARSALSTGSGITAGSAGSAIPRMPTLSSASSARTHHPNIPHVITNLPRLPPLRPVPGEFPVIPSLFGGSGRNGASNTILRLSQTSTPSGSQEEEHGHPHNINSNTNTKTAHPVTLIGTIGGSQDTLGRYSITNIGYPASQDHPPVQPFRMSQELNKTLHLGSQEPDQSHRMSQECLGADVTPSQS